MIQQEAQISSYCKKTSIAFIVTSMLGAPLLALYNFLLVILYRDLHGSAFQITLLTMLKPVMALFSLYWSCRIAQRADRLLPNLFWSGLLGRLPFFFFPLITSPWLILASAGLYMMFCRGVIPAWMEIFKQNLSGEHRSRVFSNGTALSYIEGILLAIGMGTMMDYDSQSWRWMFPIAAAVGILGMFTQAQIPIIYNLPPNPTSIKLWQQLITPWRDSLLLMKERLDFRRFQWGFMLCGSGMMIIQPALPLFFVDVLGVTYTEIAIALTVCKGVGFALTSRLWAKWYEKANLFTFSSLIFISVSIFPLLLLLAPLHLFWLYFGYFLYGVGQAGSELCWHLSGPSFAKDKDSSVFTGINVSMVGVRGLIAPPIGSLLYLFTNVYCVFIVSGVLCILSGYLMWRWAQMEYVEKIA